MAARALGGDEVGHPRFAAAPAEAPAEVFDLSSHARAREALEFGLGVAGLGFNVFVVGEDRAGRMTATLAFLEEQVARRPPASDWVYLENFRHRENPRPHPLPAGQGRKLRDRVAAMIPKLRAAMTAAVGSEAFAARVTALREAAQGKVAADLEALRAAATARGYAVTQGEDGALRLVAGKDVPEGAENVEGERELVAALRRFQGHAVAIRVTLEEEIRELQRGIADEIVSPEIEELTAELSGFRGLARWLTEMRVDLIENPAQLLPRAEDDEGEGPEPPERRHAVNLLVDHGDASHPLVVLESNPSYENLFGRIEYRQAHGTIETDFTLIRAGSLHRANGGVLVLRAEATAANPQVWNFLKAALRDREIRIEEPQRQGTTPIAGAPRPGAVPLDLKVVIVGAPRWYGRFFETDPDFQTYFKVKADIDVDLEASPANLAIYAALVRDMARSQGLGDISPEATQRLLGIAARWAERRDRLTARFELIEDLVIEASFLARQRREKALGDDALVAALAARDRRNSRVEDRVVRGILEGATMISTSGSAIGQINGLTVQDAGDRRFGSPVRITARASVGREGVVNIERAVELGGPIQQKGAMVLQGFLAGRFAQARPVAFTCSITFEQSYGGVEGDSASMAELIAVLSDLAQLPVRQDVAITGSVNQAGFAQAIGGARWKIEGFYRVCKESAAGLTGKQGVIVPDANRVNLVLHDEIADAVAAGTFHIWSVGNVEEAATLLIEAPVGVAGPDGLYPPESLYGRVAARLAEFDRILAEREAHRKSPLPRAGEG